MYDAVLSNIIQLMITMLHHISPVVVFHDWEWICNAVQAMHTLSVPKKHHQQKINLMSLQQIYHIVSYLVHEIVIEPYCHVVLMDKSMMNMMTSVETTTRMMMRMVDFFSDLFVVVDGVVDRLMILELPMTTTTKTKTMSS
jgi:hypothetical protein